MKPMAIRTVSTAMVLAGYLLCSSAAWAAFCGDGKCDVNECCESCPKDCGPCTGCGDGWCTSKENCASCPEDCDPCPLICGNGWCQEGENCDNCAQDCKTCCGDGTCSFKHSEDCITCPDDCGECPYCGDGICDLEEGCEDCPEDCGDCCGDGACELGQGEDCDTCPEDCDDCCGDGFCDEKYGEDCETCPDDCGDCCGDGFCDAEKGESCDNCKKDCQPCPECGDEDCDKAFGEDCNNCPEDCGLCCGDGTCVAAHGEDCVSCPQDCGECKCTEKPSLFNNRKFSFHLSDKQEELGSGYAVKIGVKLVTNGDADLAALKCTEGLSGGGEAVFCIKLAYQNQCLSINIDLGGKCEKGMVCEQPPQWKCNEADYCCGGSLVAQGMFSRTFEPEKGFSLWKLQLKCAAVIGGSIGGSVSGNVTWGPKCTCDKLSGWITPRVKAGFQGGASCEAKAFGKSLVDIGAKADACVNGGFSAGFGCQDFIAPAGGASLRLLLPEIKFLWFTVAATKKVWAVGSGCSGTTDY